MQQPPSGGCVLKQQLFDDLRDVRDAAAFGRLCVETIDFRKPSRYDRQPPSGGCVLKRDFAEFLELYGMQPPSGGCVLKLAGNGVLLVKFEQPPSGGCVLKLRSH